jgi:murein DD-endopeptidase MepM/ murein hydrolase activator NlpD
MEKLISVFLLFLIAPFASSSTLLRASVADFSVSNYSPQQGDTVVIYFNSTPQSVTFDNQAVDVFRYKDSDISVLPIAATKKAGNYPLKIVFGKNNVCEKQITVRTKNFPKVVLGIPKETGLTQETLTSGLQTGNEIIQNTVEIKSEDIFLNQTFGLPLLDNRRIGSVFGEIRKTGNEEIRHMGVDLTANLGAGVAAINSGVVRKTYTDAVYGNSILIDHGHGIFSGYFHLNTIKVKENDVVKKGTIIGTVGKTGYATAPHLHLSIKINGVSVDPLRFVSAFK